MKRTLELFVAVRGEGVDLPRVRAKITLRADGGPIRVRLYPAPSPDTAFHMPFTWSLEGDIKDASGAARQHVSAPTVYTRNVAHRVWDSKTTDVTVNARADEVRIVAVLTRRDTDRPPHVVFRFSPGPALDPVQTVMYQSSGDVRVRTSFRKRVRVGQEALVFDREFHGRGSERTDLLVGRIRSERSAEELLPLVEDALLLASVGMRYRVVCLGWQQDKGESVETCYRGNVPLPRQDKWDTNESLIPIEHIPAFVSRGLRALQRSAHTCLLQQALWRIVPVRREAVDRRFARLYAAIEGLVLLASRDQKRDRILTNAEFRRVRAAVSDVLAGEVKKKALRELVTEKLPELNRPTFAHAFDRACRPKRIPIDDLWPLTEAADGVSLTQLRNKFIHGDYVAHHSGLDVAADHLQWLAERLLLATLGWDRNRSHVKTAYLRHYTAHQSWRTEREHLTKLLRTGSGE